MARFSTSRLLASALLSVATITAAAQAVQTADLRIQVQPYALASYVRPAFYGSPASGGITTGVNLDGIHLLPYVEVGLDMRGVLARSTEINEASLVGGPRLSYRRSWLHPTLCLSASPHATFYCLPQNACPLRQHLFVA